MAHPEMDEYYRMMSEISSNNFKNKKEEEKRLLEGEIKSKDKIIELLDRIAFLEKSLIEIKLQILLSDLNVNSDLHPVIFFNAVKSALEIELRNRNLNFNLSPQLDLILTNINGENYPIEPFLREALEKYKLFST